MSSNGQSQRPWNNDLHVVFNFYKSDPQVAPPASNTHGKTSGATTRPYWSTIQENDLFLEGMLLKSVGNGARLPYVHYIVYNNQNASAASSDSPHASFVHNDTVLRDIASRGGYREMYTFVDHHTPLLPKRPHNPRAAYVITAFRTLGCVKELDKNWSYWSGADLIVETIPPMLKLQRLTFHKIKPGVAGSGGFAYVLMCELGEAMAHQNKTLEFVETLNDRQCGLSSMYRIEHVF